MDGAGGWSEYGIVEPFRRLHHSLSLRTRVNVLVAAVVVAAGLLLYALVSRELLGRYASLEREDVAAHLGRAAAVVNLRLARIASGAGDWAVWSDAYDYLQGRAPGFADANLVPRSLVELDVNVIALVGVDGRVVRAIAVDLDQRQEVPAPPLLLELLEGQAPFARLGDEERFAGIVAAQPHPLLVAARSVLRSDGSGPAAGTVVFARFLDEALVGELGRSLRFDFTVFAAAADGLPPEVQAALAAPPGAPARVTPAPDGRVAGYAVLNDFLGAPALVLRGRFSRAIYARGLETRSFLILSLLAVGGALGIVIAWLTGRLFSAEQERRDAASIYSASIEQISEGMVIADLASGRIVQANGATLELLGLGEEEARRTRLEDIVDGDPGLARAALDALRDGRRLKGLPLSLRRAGREPLPVEVAGTRVDQPGGRLGCLIFHDVSERRRGEERARHFAYHDALTGLPNRMLFQDRLATSIAQTLRGDETVGVLFVDLDVFKEVNDTLGHEAGDALLRETAARLRAAVRDGDTVARQGGDEFLVLLARIRFEEEAIAVCSRIVDGLRTPFRFGTRELRVTASAGIALFPRDGDDAGTLIRNAEMAMYQAKERGRDGIVMFDPVLGARLEDFVLVKHDLTGALERGEFELHYQPQVNVLDGAIEGLEALVRWRSPRHGLVPPGKFIPIAESTGLIIPLGEWVLREALRQIARWREAGIAVPRVAINISPKQLMYGNLAGTVQRLLAETGGDGAGVELEITESVAMREPETVREILVALKALGVTVALDDFGTGYSSLAYLRRFPFDRIKLDREFIRDLADNPESQALVRGIISLAGSLGMRVVAEGVETIRQLDLLCRMGCDVLQGFGLAHPAPAPGVQELLLSGRSLLAEAGGRPGATVRP